MNSDRTTFFIYIYIYLYVYLGYVQNFRIYVEFCMPKGGGQIKCPRHQGMVMNQKGVVNGRFARLGLTTLLISARWGKNGWHDATAARRTERERNVTVFSRVTDFCIDNFLFLLVHPGSTQKFEPEIAWQETPTDTD